MYRLLNLVLLALFVSITAGCAQLRAIEREATFLTVNSASETQMGAQYAAELEKSMDLIEDPEAQAWLDRVGAALVAESPKSDQTFKFYFVNDMNVNAFAIPGGGCYVNRGMMEFADNEAQVVAVIGHEINHVTRRHGISRMQREMAAQLAAKAAVLAAGNETKAIAAQAAISGTGFLAQRQFSQADESEADALGVEAMYRAGWDPREAAALWAKMSGDGPPPFWLEAITSTHPTSPKRRQDILDQCAKLDLTVPLKKDSPEFQAIKARFAKLPKPAAAQQK